MGGNTSEGSASDENGNGDATETQAGDGSKPLDALLVFMGILTGIAVIISTACLGKPVRVPPSMYVYGFLGASVYVFKSLADEFEDDGRYGYKMASRTFAALPLAAGVFLLAFAFDAGSIDAVATRVTAGLVYLGGLFVNLAIKQLGNLADRLLGVDGDSADGN